MNKSIEKTLYFVVILLLITIITSFAYFTANITGAETNTTLTLGGGVMNIDYESGNAIVVDNIYPREEAWVTKNFTLIGNNTTTLDMHYTVILKINENTFRGGALQYKLTSTNTSNNGEEIPSITEYKSIAGTKDHILGDGYFSGSITDIEHSYSLNIYFPETNKNQNYDQGKSFKGYVQVKEYTPIEIPDYYVLASDEDFTLRENVQVSYFDGDGVLLTTSGNLYQYTGSDEYVIIPEYINGTSVTTTAGMFGYMIDATAYNYYHASQVAGVASINNNIINMEYMFAMLETEPEFDSLELKYLDTSNVINMDSMFSGNNVPNLQLNYLDTSNVVQFNGMFYNTDTLSLDLSSFDISNALNMYLMFYGTKTTSIDLSSFDTTNLTEMDSMFSFFETYSLDLSSFNTSNITSMRNMFSDSKITSINFDSFDTSSVINMESMFAWSEIPTLDLSSFDTSNVIFSNNMFDNATTTTGYARTQADANKFNLSSNKPSGLTFTVK